MPNSDQGRRKVFISYSHQDAEWLKRLQIHLRDLERRGLVEFWDDTKIRPGDEWRKEICAALDSARIAVLLISADFLASDFIAEDELPPLLAAAETDGVTILPLILSPCMFDEAEGLSRYQSVNSPSQPLIKLSKGEQEEYLVKLGKAVLSRLKESEKGKAATGRTAARPVFHVPFERNKFFTGRDDLLDKLYVGFNAAGERVQALNGLGGLGKTQTALEYAYRHRQDYKTVLWVGANTRETLVADLAAIAKPLDLSQKNAADQSDAARAVRDWLAGNPDWLLILDNADDIAMVRDFMPPGENGHVLLTTRARYAGKVAESNPLETMTPEEGALLLLRQLRKLKKGESLDSALAGIRSQAEALAKELGGLPLALDQAAAFIDEKNSTLEEYRWLYQSERGRLLSYQDQLATDRDHPPVATTFSLAFKTLEENNRAAADLLRVCVFLEADSIPEEIFIEGAEELGEALGSIADSPVKLSEAIEEAGRFSLLKRQPEAQTVSLHRLVQAVLKDEMNESDKRLWAERAVRAVNEVFPDVDYPSWPACDRLIQHAQSLARMIEEYWFDFLEAARLLNQTGFYLRERAHYGEAEPLYSRALAIHEKALGPDHPDTAVSLNNLAHLYSSRGKYSEAEPLYIRALAIREKVQGPDHPSTATSLNNLALLYKFQGKYGEAEPLYIRALAIREKTQGSDHPDTAVSLNNLAALYRLKGKYGEAEPLYGRALAIREKTLGPDHPDTAVSLNNLAFLYSSQKNYGEAEPLYGRALAIREKALGSDHPDTATSLNDLAGLYFSQGKYGEAELLYGRALEIREKVHGPYHPFTAVSLNDLAGLYKSQGKYWEAESLYGRALAIYERVLGPDHPATNRVLKNYAALLRTMSRMQEAERLESRITLDSEENGREIAP